MKGNNTSKAILERLDTIEREIGTIKKVLDIDSKLSKDDMEALYETGKQKRRGELIDFELIKKELNIEFN